MTGTIIAQMIAYNYGCPELINHALKVFSFASAIGQLQNLDPDTQQTLELAAILHDIGIRASEQKYHSYSGRYQQVEGPPIAETMLSEAGIPQVMRERVCFLIAHHHEYDHIDGLDYQILVEADFLVNLFEERASRETVQQVRANIFRTTAGLQFLADLFVRDAPAPSLFAESLYKLS